VLPPSLNIRCYYIRDGESSKVDEATCSEHGHQKEKITAEPNCILVNKQ
jgi:hypothetical protein